MIKNQKMDPMIMRPITIEEDINQRCRRYNCSNQIMALVLVEILNQQGKGPLAEKGKKIMKVGCFFVEQSKIEDFAGRVFMALNALCYQNSETQLNDLESFTELMHWLYHREFDEAIKKFNELISTDKKEGLDNEKFYLKKISQYSRDQQTVEMFKRKFYTQES